LNRLGASAAFGRPRTRSASIEAAAAGALPNRAPDRATPLVPPRQESFMTLLRRSLMGAAAMVAGLALPVAAMAQAAAWPTKPVRVIATFPPGGFVDTIGRIVTPHLSAALGQNVVLENRAGAGGTIGADLVAKAPPDGYTLVFSHASPHGIAKGIYPTLPYDPVADFTHIAFIAETANTLLVKGDSPIRSVADYVAAAKARPEAIRYGSSGIGSTTHLLGELFGSVAGVKLTHVPYRGSAPSLQDLLGGQIESMFDPMTTNVAVLRDGAVRALAMTSAARVPLFPDVPTFAELGMPKMTSTTWTGLSGPKGLPPAVVATLHAAMLKVVALPEVRARFEDLASYPSAEPMSPAGYTGFVSEFVDNWTAISRSAGIVAQ